MDDPQLDAGLHRQALAGLRRINHWSGAGSAVWHGIRNLINSRRLTQPRILDLACGSGDIALYVARQAAASGLNVMVTGCDVSPVAIAEARRHAAQADPNGQAIQVNFVELDVLRGTIPTDYDIVVCSLFLHHLDETQAVALLRNMRVAARHCVLIDDLRRTRMGYWLAWFGTRLLSRSPVVRYDGPLSVAGAFTPGEALRMAEQAGLSGARIRRHWPQRFLLEWSRAA